MKGDFSRDTFDARRHFSRVLMQQGRVQLDADWNEQQDIHRYLLRTFIRDLTGPYGTPCNGAGGMGTGFRIDVQENRVFIHPGHYYVDGILCEHDAAAPLDYACQPDYPPPVPEAGGLPGKRLLVYLDVWERHISAVEDPGIRETALGGPDTCSRAKTVWQVKMKMIPPGLEIHHGNRAAGHWKNLVDPWPQESRGRLRAGTRPEGEAGTPAPAGAGYRGEENRLYRVEIHHGGGNGEAGFTWSRYNGSVVFGVTARSGDTFTLAGFGTDRRTGLAIGDWVGFEDDFSVLHQCPRPLRKVTDINYDEMSVRLSGTDSVPGAAGDHPLLRRWDQKETPELAGGGLWEAGCVKIIEGRDIPLEDGITLQFGEGRGNHYRAGDYWLIPARTATRDIEWPHGKFVPPRGIGHQYAPLAVIGREGTVLKRLADLRSPLKVRGCP